MPDASKQKELMASLETTRTKFDEDYKKEYEFCVTGAFKKMKALTDQIYEQIPSNHASAQKVVLFLCSYAAGGSFSIGDRWYYGSKAEYLKTYYSRAPTELKLAKLRRIAHG